jgi:hypothetical protein
MVLPFCFPATLILRIAGPEGGEEPAGEVLRLIQIRLTTPSFEKISLACQANSPQARIADLSSTNAVSFFIRTHNETLTVITMSVTNEDCSPARIHG